MTLAMCAGVPAAYVFSRRKFAGRKAVLRVLLLLYSFPSVLSMFAIYKLMSTFGMINTRAGLIIIYAQLNLLDSHDVSRFLSLCGNDLRKMKLAVLFQMTFVGMPCIFYGDELGMTGFSEEEYRHPMEWENTSHPLHEFYRKSIALRKRYPALRRGAFVQEASDDHVFHYSRILDEEKITVILNRSDTVVSFMPCKEFLWKSGEQNAILEPYGFVVMKG